MRLISLFLLFSLMSSLLKAQSNSTANELAFTKQIFKIPAVIKQEKKTFIIVPLDSKDIKYLPTYLPEEYKINGLNVTLDGEIGKQKEDGYPLAIKKIWVEYKLKEKYNLAHKMYDLN